MAPSQQKIPKKITQLGRWCLDAWQVPRTPPQPPLPPLVVEISSTFLSMAKCTAQPARVAGFAARHLPPGSVEPSPSRPHLRNPGALGELLREMIEEIGAEPGECALLVPDVAVRVLPFTAESLPRKRGELEPFLLWRMKESLPFNPREAVISHQLRRTAQGLEVLVVAMARPILEGYEALARSVDLEPYWVLPSSLALLPLVPDAKGRASLQASSTASGPISMLVHRDGHALTCAVRQSDALRFYRCRPLGGEPSETDGRAEAITDEVLPLLTHWESKRGTKIERIAFTARGSAGPELLIRLGEKLGVPVEALNVEGRVAQSCPAAAKNLFLSYGVPVAGLLANAD